MWRSCWRMTRSGSYACRSLYEKLAPLRGFFKQIRRSLIPLEDISLDCRSKHQRIRDQIRWINHHLAGSSRSKSGHAFSRSRPINEERTVIYAYIHQRDSDHPRTFAAVLRCCHNRFKQYQQIQACRAFYPSQTVKMPRAQDTCVPYIETVWWNGYLKLLMEHQITYCAGLSNYGGANTTPRMDLDLPCVLVGWWLSFFGRIGRRLRCISLGRGRFWSSSGYALIGGPVGEHLIDLDKSGLIAECFRKIVAPGLLYNHKGVYLLVFFFSLTT